MFDQFQRERRSAPSAAFRAGQGGSVGAGFAARQPPDDDTLLLTTTATRAINLALYANIPYDPLRDFTPIALVARKPLMMVVATQLLGRELAYPSRGVERATALAGLAPETVPMCGPFRVFRAP